MIFRVPRRPQITPSELTPFSTDGSRFVICRSWNDLAVIEMTDTINAADANITAEMINNTVAGITLVSGMLSLPASIIILMTIFGNLLVLCFKARVGRTNTTLLVWNLGLTDFLVGVIVLPLGAFHLINQQWIFGDFLCHLWVAADVTFCTCSVVTICVISVDRYMAVTRPLRYKSIVTKSRVILVMIIIWSFSISIPLATWKWNDLTIRSDNGNSKCFAGDQIRYLAHSVVLAFFLPASVTLSLYWRIYNLARKRQKALDRGFLMILGHNMNFLTNTISQQTTLRVHFGRKNGMVEHQRRVLRTHERIAKTLGVVSCSFLFCWLPFFSLYLTNFKCGCIPPMAIDVASWLGYCNSMLNPIIYSFTVKEFKKSAQRMMLPLWTLAHRLLPFIRPPPDGLNLKMSRHGNEITKLSDHSLISGVDGNRKSRPHSFVELGKNKSGVLTSRVTRQRRQTEPAVFASLDVQKRLGKVAAKDAETPMPTTIIEEDDEVCYSEVNSLTSYSSSFSESRFVSPRKKSSTFTRMPTLTERKSLELTTSNGVSASSGGPSEHSIRMHYDTIEADV